MPLISTTTSKYFLSDPQYIGIFTAINTVLRLALMIAVLPFFMKRFGKRNSLMLAIIFIAAGYGVRYLDVNCGVVHI